VDNFLGLSRCDAMESNVLVHGHRGSHDPLRHPELVSGSYFPRRNSKMLKRVQHDGGWTTGRPIFMPLCLCAFVRDTLAQRLVLAGLCARALWARAHPARPFFSGLYRTCHRNSITTVIGVHGKYREKKVAIHFCNPWLNASLFKLLANVIESLYLWPSSWRSL
jgi:hypothetical protein